MHKQRLLRKAVKQPRKKHQEENMKPFTFYDIYYAPVKALDDKQATTRRRGAARRKSAPRPKSTLQLFGKRTERR